MENCVLDLNQIKLLQQHWISEVCDSKTLGEILGLSLESDTYLIWYRHDNRLVWNDYTVEILERELELWNDLPDDFVVFGTRHRKGKRSYIENRIISRDIQSMMVGVGPLLYRIPNCTDSCGTMSFSEYLFWFQRDSMLEEFKNNSHVYPGLCRMCEEGRWVPGYVEGVDDLPSWWSGERMDRSIIHGGGVPVGSFKVFDSDFLEVFNYKNINVFVVRDSMGCVRAILHLCLGIPLIKHGNIEVCRVEDNLLVVTDFGREVIDCWMPRM